MSTPRSHKKITGNWAVDYVNAVLAVQEEAELDRPEDTGNDPEHAWKLAMARTEILKRQRRALDDEKKQGQHEA